jgi:hypothetical protein
MRCGLALAIVCALGASSASASPPPPRLPPGYRPANGDRVVPELIRHADGSYEHRNRDAGFAATIHTDGSVTVRSIARVKIHSSRVLDALRGKPQPTDDEKFNAKSNTLTKRGAQTDTKNDPVIQNGSYGAAPILFSMGAQIGGLADWLTKGSQSRARHDFLVHTATLRARLRAETQRARERQAIADLGATMRAIWADTTLDAAARRRALFELWDDCAEAGEASSPEDVARAEAGAKARRVIEAFMRRTAVPNSAKAYTATELGRLNAARRSVARFDPYAAK